MELLEGIMTRRSVRDFEKGRRIDKEQMETIIRAGMNAPSALGQHAWRFLTITDREKLEKIAGLKDWWSMLNEASLGIGILIDTKASNGLGEEFLVISAAAASENMMLAAHALGIGSVFLGADCGQEYYEELCGLLNIGQGLRLIGIIAAGYAKTGARGGERYEDEKWIREHF